MAPDASKPSAGVCRFTSHPEISNSVIRPWLCTDVSVWVVFPAKGLHTVFRVRGDTINPPQSVSGPRLGVAIPIVWLSPNL